MPENLVRQAQLKRQAVDFPDRPAREEIASWLELLIPRDRVIQLFVKGYQRDASSAVNLYGFFDNIFDLVKQADRYPAKAQGVYFTLNPLHDRLFDRCPNQLRVAKRDRLAAKNDILSRELLLIDIDPRRPSGTSSTNNEKQLAARKVRQVYEMLKDLGWPRPMFVDSGNGFHLIYRIDLPTNDDNIVRSVLKTLASKFDDEGAQVDTSVFDPVRLCKLPGTMACKGTSTKERPHRFSRVLHAARQMVCVETEKMIELVESPTRSEIGLGGGSLALNWLLRDARNYVEKMPAAISGQHGHDATYAVACRLVIDFNLSIEDAMPIIRAYNDRCRPRWPDDDLLRKLREADKQLGRRGRLVRPRGKVNDTARPTQRSIGNSRSFQGWIPDFAYLDANTVFVPIADYCESEWIDAMFWLAVWQQQRSDAIVPDILLRQCRWGSSFPKNWRATLRKWLADVTLIESRKPTFRCPSSCPCHGSGVRHQHYVSPSRLSHGVLESFCIQGLNRDHRKFGLFSKEKELSERRTAYKKQGRLLTVYWPILVFGDSPRIRFTVAQQRLLLAITRELTYDKRSQRVDRAHVVTNGRVPVGRASAEAICPLLDLSRSYVVFGGNGRAVFRGKGYRLLDSGWLRRAGYRQTSDYKVIMQHLSVFVDDLLVLANALDLTIIGRHSGSKRWVAGELMPQMLKTGHGTEILAESRISIYAPEDYLSLWRRWFSQRLGFDWIPDSRDDSWCDEPFNGSHNGLLIDNAEKAREFMEAHRITQIALAEQMGCSRERVSRHLNGHRDARQFFQELSDIAESMTSQRE